MINTILISLLIHQFLILIFKPKNNILACGLFAWLGENVEDFNKDKFDKLGIYNDSRGKHSCGVSVDGEIEIGVDKLKLYKDFIINKQVANPKLYPAVLGHTRYATGGAHNVDNAHPFGFGENNKTKDGFGFIGVHNGTLHNHEELAVKYGVDLKDDKRTKIDSEALLEIIYKSKNLKVLNEYVGAAALIYTNVNEPNVVYCYHGKSKETEYSKEFKEERPLFYYKESKNSLYVSSQDFGLMAIGGTDETIGSFDYNTVYKITNGDIENAVKTKISRRNMTQKKPYTYSNNVTKNNNKKSNSKSSNVPNCRVRNLSEEDYNDLFAKGESSEINLHHENKDPNQYSGKIYMNKLRYWRNGHLITGIYTWIKGYGFYYLGESNKSAVSTFYSYTNKPFVDNYFKDSSRNRKLVREGKATIPFPHMKDNEITQPPLFYFYKGIRVKTKMDYEICLQYDGTHREFNWKSLTFVAKHPILDIDMKNVDSDTQDIMINYELVNDIIAPLGSDMIYTINKGNCTNIKPIISKMDPKTIKSLDEATKDLDEEIDKKVDEEALNEDNDLVDKLISDIFTKPYRDFPIYLKTLNKDYKHNARANQASEILTNFLKETTNLIAIDKHN